MFKNIIHIFNSIQYISVFYTACRNESGCQEGWWIRQIQFPNGIPKKRHWKITIKIILRICLKLKILIKKNEYGNYVSTILNSNVKGVYN